MANYVDHFDITTEEEESYRTYVKDRDLVNPNLLRATNSCTEIGEAYWENGSWGGGGTGDFAGIANAAGKTSVDIDDCPAPDINIGWELSNSESAQSDVYLQQREIPLEANEPYTMSCYVKGHGYFRMYLTSSEYGTYEETIDSSDWEYRSFIPDVSNESTGRVFYTVIGTDNGGSEGIIDICGMKLEKGETATDWCPSYWDMDDKNFTEQTLDLDKEETEVTSFTGFLDKFISGTRVGQWFKDFWAGCQYILHVGSLVNNCVSENPDLPLAAAQGKVLMDEITQVKSDLTQCVEKFPSGQTGSMIFFFAGYVSSSRKEITMQHWIGSRYGTIKSAYIDSVSVRQNGYYLLSSYEYGEVAFYQYTLGGRFTMNFDEAFDNATNNDVCFCNGNITLEFE